MTGTIADVPPWDAATITDDTYRTKFTVLPHIIEDWAGELDGKDILDFGCGEGTTAIGIALQHRRSRVVGVDIMPDVERCRPLAQAQLGLAELPPSLRLHRIAPGSLPDAQDRFDVIYSWSVFEHIEQGLLPGVLRQLRGVLKPGGVIFIQIAPLFYSADGSHLMHWVPEPWGHLLNQHDVYLGKLAAACGDAELLASLTSMFETLNRLTAPGLVRYAEEAGFDVVRRYQTQRAHPIPDALAETYRPDVLLTEQVAILLRPAGQGGMPA